MPNSQLTTTSVQLYWVLCILNFDRNYLFGVIIHLDLPNTSVQIGKNITDSSAHPTNYWPFMTICHFFLPR